MLALRSFMLCLSLSSMCLTITLVARGDSRVIDKSCVERVLSEGVSAWKEAASIEDDVQVICNSRIEERTVGNGKVSAITGDEFWKISWNSSNSRRIIEHEYTGKGAKGIFVANAEYKFLVGKNPSTESSGYTLNSCYDYTDPKDFFRFEPAEETAYYDLIGSGYRILGVSLIELMNQVDFKLAGARYIEVEDHRLVRVEWECIRGSELWKSPGTDYWADLNPENFWLIVRGGIKMPTRSMELLQETVYQSIGAGATPFPARFTQSARMGNYTKLMTCTFEKPQKCDRSNEEYTLPHYGFPESAVRASAPRTWVRLVMIVLGVLGVVVSVLIHRLSVMKPKGNPA